jgi:hypothetical protein
LKADVFDCDHDPLAVPAELVNDDEVVSDLAGNAVIAQEIDARGLALPLRRRAADKRDEFAPSHPRSPSLARFSARGNRR